MKLNFKKICIYISLLIITVPFVVEAQIKKVSCGNESQGLNGRYSVPARIPELTTFGIRVLEVAVPVLLVIFGSIDLIKAISSGKEDEMKKAQSTLIKRLIAGVLVFFIFVIVKFVISIVAGNGTTGILGCLDCFVNNNDSCKVMEVKK